MGIIWRLQKELNTMRTCRLQFQGTGLPHVRCCVTFLVEQARLSAKASLSCARAQYRASSKAETQRRRASVKCYPETRVPSFTKLSDRRPNASEANPHALALLKHMWADGSNPEAEGERPRHMR